MQKDLVTGQILVLSQRREFISMCAKYFENNGSVCYKQEFSEDLVDHYKTIIIDADLIHDFSSFLRNKDESYFRKIIFLIPGFSLQNEYYELKKFCQFIIPYPCTYPIFQGILNHYFERLSEKKEDCLVPNAKNPCKNILGFFGGDSPIIKNVRSSIHEVSRLESPVLLLGETGTGKTTAARLIHTLSTRKDNRFVQINLATVVDSLAESILFGSNKGSYTDAVNQDGLILPSHKGTLFFDEAGCASVNTQAALLTFVETKQLVKVGSKTPVEVDARMIFATNNDMHKMLVEGSFRSDLYFRISDNVIKIPPLRDHIEDIKVMVDQYLNDSGISISKEALCLLEEYDWPGNIRELHKCLERSINSCENSIIQISDIDFGLF